MLVLLGKFRNYLTVLNRIIFIILFILLDYMHSSVVLASVLHCRSVQYILVISPPPPSPWPGLLPWKGENMKKTGHSVHMYSHLERFCFFLSIYCIYRVCADTLRSSLLPVISAKIYFHSLKTYFNHDIFCPGSGLRWLMPYRPVRTRAWTCSRSR